MLTMGSICSVSQCARPHLAKGFCNRHWLRWKRHAHPLAGGVSPNPSGLLCSVKDCERPSKSAKGLCILHSRRLKRSGTTDRPHKKNEATCLTAGCPEPSTKLKVCDTHYATLYRKRKPLYALWLQMKQRCTNPNLKQWHRYGGRGIAVCARWQQSFEDFVSDMGPRPSSKHQIDRIDNDGHYEPANCHWATAKEQTLNHPHWRHA